MPKRVPCPFVKVPFDECHVSSMSSISIVDAVYYCGGNFRECEIFKKHTEPGQEKDGDTEKIAS